MWNICKFDATFRGLLCFWFWSLAVCSLLCLVPRLPCSEAWTLKLCRHGDTYLRSGGPGNETIFCMQARLGSIWNTYMLPPASVPDEVLPKVESLETRLHVLCSGWLMQHNIKGTAFYREMWFIDCSWHCPCEYDSSSLLNFFLSFSQPSSPFSHAVSCGFGGSACHS